MVWNVLRQRRAVSRGWSSLLPTALIGLLVVVAVGCTSADEGLVDDVVLVGSPEDVTIEEFVSTVVPAAEMLSDTGFRALEQVVLDTGTVEWRWLDYRPDSEQSDYPIPGTWSVVEATEFAEAEEPAVRVTANVVTGDSLYTAQFRQADTQTDASWSAQPRPTTDLGMFPLRLLAIHLDRIEDYYRSVNEEFSADLKHQQTEDGGSIWTTSYSPSSGTAITETLGINPNGHLRTYEFQVNRSGTGETSDTGQLPEPASAATATIRFLSQPHEEAHLTPEVGGALNLEKFELPPEFPIDE